MRCILFVWFPQDLADWLDETSRKSGLSRGFIVRQELERARNATDKPWMRLAGNIKNILPDLSVPKGFSRK